MQVLIINNKKWTGLDHTVQKGLQLKDAQAEPRVAKDALVQLEDAQAEPRVEEDAQVRPRLVQEWCL